MSTYKPLDDRQVINRAALSNIGSAANDSLDNILALINDALAGITTSAGYVAHIVTLTSGSTSSVVTIPEQPDTSFIVLGMMGNVTDSHPQYQQIEVTAKSRTGFTFSWNHPLDSANYFISYVIPFKQFPEAEYAIGSGASTLSATLAVPQGASTYPVIAQLQNTVDAHPQFQTTVVGSNTMTSANFSWNALTDSSNYQMVYGILGTGMFGIGSGVSSVVVNLPVNFNTSSYALLATMQNISDSLPQYQPLLITAQGASSATISWPIVTDASSYTLTYYAISLTPQSYDIDS